MSDVTGALHHLFGDRTYTLRLTMAGIAKLQGMYGNDLGGFMTGRYDPPEDEEDLPEEERKPREMPPFQIMLDIVRVALEKGERISGEEAEDLADDMLTADKALWGKVWAAAFPEAQKGKKGNGKAPTKAKS